MKPSVVILRRRKNWLWRLTMAGIVFSSLLAEIVCAASFDGTARVDVADSTGALSWNSTANAMTVSCWFKLSVPSTVTLTKNMVILANARSSNPASAFAYLIQFNITTGNVEFTARGSSALSAQTLISRPYLDRWYHVAVTCSGNDFTGYLDGRSVFFTSNAIGTSTNTTGVFIGGTPDDNANLYGEVQQVAIYQSVLPQDTISQFMFSDQPVSSKRAFASRLLQTGWYAKSRSRELRHESTCRHKPGNQVWQCYFRGNESSGRAIHFRLT